MNEEQRRALFALREALRLCEGARVCVYSELRQGSGLLYVSLTGTPEYFDDSLDATDIDRILEAHPE